MPGTWWLSFILLISNFNVLLVKSQYSGWYGSQQAYPGYSTPLVISGDGGDDSLKCILPILLLLLLDNIGGNGGSRCGGGCCCGCCGCCCGGNNSGNTIPIPYPIPIPINNPIIT